MSFVQLIKDYKILTIITIILGFAANGLSLYVPKLAANAIDKGVFPFWSPTLMTLVVIALLTFIIASIQMYVSTYLS